MYASYELVDGGPKVGIVGTGWLPALPDLRDYTQEKPEIQVMTKKLGMGASRGPKAETSVNLREWCSEVENQGQLGSCTAHAAVGIVEYYQRKAFGKHLEGSRLFVYKATRNLMQQTGDTGAWLRNTMGALVLCGVPEEKYWPYTDQSPQFDREPSSFVYSIADDFEALKYFCHDPASLNLSGSEVLERVKQFLQAKIPSMFGFFGFPSFSAGDNPGEIPYPCDGEQAQWGHAIVAVGYDDDKEIKNTRCGTTKKGALLIRNSWGTDWGADGYGWLPYAYVENKLAVDFWSLLKMDWVDSGEFGFR
jgi:C1A family cysteine protease